VAKPVAFGGKNKKYDNDNDKTSCARVVKLKYRV